METTIQTNNPSRIHKLDTQLANQIAAGEVVERPASIIKELLENSLDAKATQIDIRIEQGGMNRIMVTDNGHGMHPDDLVLALQRHATSKLSSSNDLHAIATLGFRGEALASIASVAITTLTSRLNGNNEAYQISFNPATEAMQGPIEVGHAVGTTICVDELFYTVPARKHFLRSKRTEFGHIEDTVRRLAMVNHQVAFRLWHDDKLVLQCRPSGTVDTAVATRVKQLLGPAFLQQAKSVDATAAGGLQLNGYVGAAEQARSQSDQQFLYINGRMIRDKLLLHAIRQAYQDQIYPGRYPQFVLFLEVNPAEVDVNVHPTKHEVRFRQGRVVHDFLVQSIMKALTGFDSQGEIAQPEIRSVLPKVTAPSWEGSTTLHSQGQVVDPAIKSRDDVAGLRDGVSGPRDDVAGLRNGAVERKDSEAVSPPGASFLSPGGASVSSPRGLTTGPIKSTVPNHHTPRNWKTYPNLQLSKQWLLVKEQGALIFINQQVALAAMAFAAFNAEEPLTSMPLLLPLTVKLSATDVTTIAAQADRLVQELALELAPISDTEVVVRAMPAVLRLANSQRLLQQLLVVITELSPDWTRPALPAAVKQRLADCLVDAEPELTATDQQMVINWAVTELASTSKAKVYRSLDGTPAWQVCPQDKLTTWLEGCDE